MGMNVVPLKELTPEEPTVKTLDLLKNMDLNDGQNEKSRGQLVVEFMYKPFKEEDLPKSFEESQTVQKAPENTPAGGGLLVVIVHEAQDVEGKHHTNPYARILFRGEERKTKVLLPVPYDLFLYNFHISPTPPPPPPKKNTKQNKTQKTLYLFSQSRNCIINPQNPARSHIFNNICLLSSKSHGNFCHVKGVC